MIRAHHQLGWSALSLCALVGCGNDAERGVDLARAGESTSALTTESVFGFESTTDWSLSAGSLSSTSVRSQGSAALKVTTNGYAQLTSAPLSTLSAVGATLSLDVRPEGSSPWGYVQLVLDAPSRGLYSRHLAQASVVNLPVNQFSKLDFTLPDDVQAALGGSYSDLRVTLVINAPPNGFVLDNLRFSGGVALAPAPTGLRAYGGGNEVALFWDRATGSGVASYQIFRDDTLLQTVAPSSGTKDHRYLDAAAAKGASHVYQVAAISGSGIASARATVSVLHPNIEPPTIFIDDARRPQLRPYLERAKSVIELWYPKVTALLAYPVYQPLSTFTLHADNCGIGGYAAGDGLYLCDGAENLFGADRDDTGLWVHESTHLLQNYVDGAPTAIGEGIASWIGDLASETERDSPPDWMSYLNGYEYSAYFYGWIQSSQGKPDFIRNMNLRSHAAVFDYDWFRQETGKTVNQLWQEMIGVELQGPGYLRSQGGCAQVLVSPPEGEQRRARLAGCSFGNSQIFVYEPGLGRLHVEAECLDVDANGRVVPAACHYEATQGWAFKPTSGGLGRWEKTGAVSGCLQLQPTAGLNLIVTTCSDATIQLWSNVGP